MSKNLQGGTGDLHKMIILVEGRERISDQRAHYGVLIVPYSLPGDQFSRIAGLIKKFSSVHQKGMAP